MNRPLRHPRKFALVVALVVVDLLVIGVPDIRPAFGTSYIPAEREMTAEQTVQRSVSDADVICVGRILAIRDTVTSFGYPYSELLLEPRRFLKGRATGRTVRIAFTLGGMFEPTRRQVAQRLSTAGPYEALVFLTEHQGGLLLNNSPMEFGGGLLEVVPADRAAIEGRVSRQVRGQTLDSLVARADAAILGNWQGAYSPCEIDGREARCKDVTIDSVIVGPLAQGTVQVAFTYAQDIPLGQSVFFLRRLPSGVYEPVQFKAGVRTVRLGRVSRPDTDLDTFVGSIRESSVRVRPSHGGR